MIKFLHNYGLWLVLAGVFIAMHRFGTGCCGGGHHRRPSQRDGALPDENPKGGKKSETASHPTGNCH